MPRNATLMRRLSLRAVILVASTVFAILVVGGIGLATYVIISNGMQDVSADTVDSLSSTAEAVVHEVVEKAGRDAEAQGLSGDDAVEASREMVASRLPEAIARAGMPGVELALFDKERVLIWGSRSPAMSSAQVADRADVLSSGLPKYTVSGRGGLVSGLFSRARLGAIVRHTPVRLSGGENGVLDVMHTPVAEDGVMDAVRGRMVILMVIAVLVLVLLSQAAALSVLGPVENLRVAADSIDAGRLDERLPVAGNREIAELALSLNHLIERLMRRNEAQMRFVADASHELATPVAGIRGYTSILRAWGADDPKVRDEAVDAIDRESRRMARLTADLLNLLHADQGLVLRSERFDLNPLVRQRLAATASRWIEKDIDFEGPEVDSLFMVGDRDRVEDIISILLDNAAKYTPECGKVTVHTWLRRENVLIEVADTGQGIPAEDLERIFGRFFRSASSRAAGESGFGLGLAILRSIVENMGGKIHVSSTVGEGTTFSVSLPKGRIRRQ